MGNIRTIIWDLDGTLLDSFGLYVEILREILPLHKRPMPALETMQRNYHGSLDDAIGAALDESDPAEVRKIVTSFLAAQDAYYDVVEGHLFKDAEALAQRSHAHGARQILVTNRNHTGHFRASPRSIVANSDLHKYIDIVICGDDSEHRKPKPEVLGELIQDVVPRETVVIGDQFVDAEFAHNLGARAILVNRNGEQPHHLDRLSHDWQSHVTLVDSLHSIVL